MHDRTEVAPGVFRRVQQRRAVYSGSPDDLQACGLVAADMLPGQPGNPRGMVTFDSRGERIRRGGSSRPEPRHMRIVRVRGKGGEYFEIWLLLSPARLACIEGERTRAVDWPFPGLNDAVTRRAPGVPAAMLQASNGGSAGIGRRAAPAGAGA